MKSTNPYQIHPNHRQNTRAQQSAKTLEAPGSPTPPPTDASIRTSWHTYINPVDYQHPFESMARFAQALALRYDANRTRHAYDRQVRLLQEHFDGDPTLLLEAQVRDCFLFVKLKKQWKPTCVPRRAKSRFGRTKS